VLLDEIIDILSDSKGSLTDALLKTKVLLHTIGKKELAAWVTYELKGYPDQIVPDYRVVSAEVHGTVTSIAWQVQDYLLPIRHLEKETQDNLTSMPCTMSIEGIEESIKSHRTKGTKLVRSLPPEMGALLGKALTSGTNVMSAWCQINMVQVENILAEVRSRLLDFALELRDVVGIDAPNNELAKIAANVDAGRIFTTAIYGGTNTLVVGSHGVQSVNVSNSKGDLAGLLKAISGLGIEPHELEDLKQAVIEDQRAGKTPDVAEGKTGHWFSKTLKSAGKGVVKAGVDVVSTTIVKAIQAYTGSG
jgi:hypothetical protein